MGEQMLNLKIGRCYMIKTALGGEYKGIIRSKTVHGEKTDSYLLTYPGHPGILMTGLYVWDHGVANKDFTTFFFTFNPIVECKELTAAEITELYEKSDQHYAHEFAQPLIDRLRREK